MEYVLMIELPDDWSELSREAFFGRMLGQMPPGITPKLCYWDQDEQHWNEIPRG